MAIDRDLTYKTAISIDYSRTGNTLNRRERHGVKDSTGAIIVTFDETTSFTGNDALDYLENLIISRDSKQVFLDKTIAQHDAEEADQESTITFQTTQITEIEALLP